MSTSTLTPTPVPDSAVDRCRLLTARQVGEMLGCSWRTVYRMADAGRLPVGLKLGSLRRWDKAELEAWITARCPAIRRG